MAGSLANRSELRGAPAIAKTRKRAAAPRRSCLQSKSADAGTARAVGRFETSRSSLRVKSRRLRKSRE